MKICIPKIRIVRKNREKYSTIDIVPKKLRSYLVDMNHYFNNVNGDVFRGRNKEVERIFNSLLKPHNSNVLLVGDHGVGKKATVQIAVYKILKNKCPNALKNYHFIRFNIEKMLIALQNDNENSIVEIINFLSSYTNIVVVIDQIHLISYSTVLAYYIKKLFKMHNVGVIGIATQEEFSNLFENQNKILSMLDIIPIEEPKSDKIYPMIKQYLKSYEKAYNISIPEDIVCYMVSVSSASSTNMSNPGLVMNLIDKSIVVAARKKHTTITRDDVNYNLNFRYDLYNKIPYFQKKLTTYHEAGHFVIYYKSSDNITTYKVTAITNIPTEDFAGANLLEYNSEMHTSLNQEYFMNDITVDLGGRAAEELILQENGVNARYTAGAVSDLKNATRTARAIVTEYGMIKSCGENMTYFCEHDLLDLMLLSEERKKDIDREVQNIIKIAYERAQKILTENRELLDAIAKSLMENGVLDEKDLKKICDQF